MGWAVGFDPSWGRDIGYGVPATCDEPDCGAKIDRGLGYVCGGDVYGGQHGCGLFFCTSHLTYGADEDDPQVCGRCVVGAPPPEPTPDLPEWTQHKLTDPSWATWRQAHGHPEPSR